MDKKKIIRIYNLLNGTYKAVKEIDNNLISKNEINQFNWLLNDLFSITQDEYFSMYEIGKNDYFHEEDKDCLKGTFLLKLLPILDYINNIYIDNTDEVIQKIGALYNAIEDTELQKRCGDILLESSGAFDRVINQATQVLEDRIKQKAKLQSTNLIGLPLVCKAIHSKLEMTILKFSDNEDIQDKYSALFKGVIGVYRNSTHHGLDYKCTREEALKFCAYIDSLLKEVEKSELVVK